MWYIKLTNGDKLQVQESVIDQYIYMNREFIEIDTSKAIIYIKRENISLIYKLKE